MTVRYEVRQQVQTYKQRWLSVVHEGEFERPARDCYESLKRDYPLFYFELVEVLHTENCLDFTPKPETKMPHNLVNGDGALDA
jgi:hypothetical protein